MKTNKVASRFRFTTPLKVAFLSAILGTTGSSYVWAHYGGHNHSDEYELTFQYSYCDQNVTLCGKNYQEPVVIHGKGDVPIFKYKGDEARCQVVNGQVEAVLYDAAEPGIKKPSFSRGPFHSTARYNDWVLTCSIRPKLQPHRWYLPHINRTFH